MSESQVQSFDVVIIGGGPAGYVGAIRAAQLGLSVACVERENLGGICLNWGCIPTKALLAAAEFYAKLKGEASDWGVLVDNVQHDWSKVIGRSRGTADRLSKGIAGLLKKNKVTHVQGHARIPAPGKVEVTDRDGKVTARLSAVNIVIATGAGPRSLPGAEFDGKQIIGYREAMSLAEQPKHLVIVGAGAIGVEFAYFYNAFGTKVTLVEMLDAILPIEDQEVSKTLLRSFKKYGIDVRTATRTMKVEKGAKSVKVTLAPVSDDSKTEVVEADKVLVAIGVKGKYDGLFDDALGLELFKDHIKVNRDTYETSVKGIYAVGDVIGPPWLAHVASEEAVNCIEQIAGHDHHPIDYGAIPGCTYCLPQVASFGKTEQALAAEGLKPGTHYKVGKFPFAASGKAVAVGHTDGFVKILTDVKYGEILGVHMIGESVTELLAEMGLARRLEATAEEIMATMHAHPTLSEAIHEAALGTAGRMIHF